MLKTRILTALALLAVLLPELFMASPWPFALTTLLLIGAAGWEWSRLNGLPGKPAIGFGAGLVAIGGGALLLGGLPLALSSLLWWLSGLVWVLGGAQALRGGPTRWPQVARPLRLMLGVLALLLAWAALVQAKSIGVNFLLSVLCLVWVADIAAYFGGRAFGRRKLAPAISPGKSWEGVWAGMAGVLLLGLFWASQIDLRLDVDSPSLYQLLFRQGLPIGLLSILFLGAMSVVGDLFESLVKRAAGAKDSSNLLPGHGGVLDRADALLPVFPLAMALISLGPLA